MFRFFACLLLLTGICFASFAQYSDTVVRFYDEEWHLVTNPKKTDYTYYRLAVKDKSSGAWMVKDCYANNQLQMEGTYKDDSLKIKNGRFYYYHPNGTIKKSIFYVDDKAVGLSKGYSQDSVLVDTARFNMQGLPIGIATKWKEDGSILFKGEYDERGSGKGYETEYFNNGSLSSFGKYSEGYIMDSTWTYYHHNGNMSLQEEYNKGLLTSCTCFDENGIVQSICDTSTVYAKSPYDPYTYLGQHTRMPDEIKFGGYGGKMVALIGFTVGLDGSVKDLVLVKESHPAINKEALRVVGTFPKWEPAKHKNRAIESYFTIPVIFMLYH